MDSPGRLFCPFHAAWQSPDARIGITLANWTTKRQKVTVVDPRLASLGGKALLHLSAKRMTTRTPVSVQDWTVVSLPPLSCALLEGNHE
jgi:hypothetical protein